MLMTSDQLAAALDKISEGLGLAGKSFDEHYFADDEWGAKNAEWHLELAFVQLMALAEALELPMLRGDVAGSLTDARTEGLLTVDSDPDGYPHQKYAAVARRYWAALGGNFVSEPARTVTKDLATILREATYAITDAAIHGAAPKNENEVHRRVENLLKPFFPDLIHKPRLGKAIKNFEPDTGLPSIQTLIEYKFLSSNDQVGRLADELLADTRGYKSRDWTAFVYAIYETARFRSESQWREFFRQSGVESSAILIVMSGHPISRQKRPSKPAPQAKRTLDDNTGTPG